MQRQNPGHAKATACKCHNSMNGAFPLVRACAAAAVTGAAKALLGVGHCAFHQSSYKTQTDLPQHYAQAVDVGARAHRLSSQHLRSTAVAGRRAAASAGVATCRMQSALNHASLHSAPRVATSPAHLHANVPIVPACERKFLVSRVRARPTSAILQVPSRVSSTGGGKEAAGEGPGQSGLQPAGWAQMLASTEVQRRPEGTQVHVR